MSRSRHCGLRAALARAFSLVLAFAVAACAAGRGQEGLGARADRYDSSASGRSGVSLRLARATHEAGDLASAVQLYRQLGSSTSAEPQVLVELGDCLVEAGEYDEAIAAYARVETGPAKLGALLGRIRAEMALNDPATALRAADQALALAPRDPRVLVNRGAVLDMLGRHAAAQEAYRMALGMNPRSVAARNNLALSLALTGQYDQAVTMIEPLARATSASPKIRANLALILALSGDTDRASAVSRVDLDEPAVAGNMNFFALVRDAKP